MGDNEAISALASWNTLQESGCKRHLKRWDSVQDKWWFLFFIFPSKKHSATVSYCFRDMLMSYIETITSSAVHFEA